MIRLLGMIRMMLDRLMMMLELISLRTISKRRREGGVRGGRRRRAPAAPPLWCLLGGRRRRLAFGRSIPRFPLEAE